MLSNCFMNLVRGNTVANYLGVVGKVQEDYVFYKDYSNLMCYTGYSSKKHVKAGDRVILRPKIQVNPKKCKLMVVPNPELFTLGQVAYPTLLEEGEGEYLQLTITATKDFEVDNLKFLCRIYAIYG